MESSPSSRISFFTHSGVLLQTPIEGMACGIAVMIPREMEKLATLKLGTTALPLWFPQDSMCALSAWPESPPGQYKISLECGEIRERRVLTILPQHFSEIEFSEIVRELSDELPLSIGNALQKCGGFSGVTLVSTGEQSVTEEYKRLKRLVRGTSERPGILQLLPMIQRDCYQVLKPQHELRKANKARRPDISKLPSIISMPGNISASGKVGQLFDVIVESSYETYENRLVKAYVQAIQSQLSRLSARVEEEQAPPAVESDFQELFSEFRLTVARTAFLKQVRLPFVGAGRITMVLLKKPAYRTVLEDYLALFKQASIRLEEPSLNTPLNRFAFLYELWAAFKVINCMVQVCAELGYQCVDHKWIQRDLKGFCFGPMQDGTIALELTNPRNGKTVKVIPWSPASGQVPSNHKLDMPPAIAISIYTERKAPVVLVFDPTYRVSGDTPEQAVKRMSAPADQLADTFKSLEPPPDQVEETRRLLTEVRSPVGIREVHYAGILYPGFKRQYAPDFEAFSARPDDGGEFERHVSHVLRHYLT